MAKFLTLLKYADPKKITPEAVKEICGALQIKLTDDQAAEIANAYRTRGMTGLMPYLPMLLETRHSQSCLVVCPHCGLVVN